MQFGGSTSSLRRHVVAPFLSFDGENIPNLLQKKMCFFPAPFLPLLEPDPRGTLFRCSPCFQTVALAIFFSVFFRMWCGKWWMYRTLFERLTGEQCLAQHVTECLQHWVCNRWCCLGVLQFCKSGAEAGGVVISCVMVFAVEVRRWEALLTFSVISFGWKVNAYLGT